MGIQLIFNADDFGRSSRENQSIIKSVQLGVVRSVTVMANFEAAQEIVALREYVPDLNAGIHLNLTEGKPILPPEKVSSLIGRDGSFFPKHLLITYICLGKVSMRQVLRELQAQIDKALKLCGELSHADSHQNVHILPGILNAAARACFSRGISRIRSQCEFGANIWNTGKGRVAKKWVAVGKKSIKVWRQQHLENLGMSSPVPLLAGVPGYLAPRDSWRQVLSWWEEMMPRLPDGAYEVCLHPGYCPSQEELMKSEQFKELLQRFHCRSISYKEIGAS